jgi:NAD+ synthetase
MIDYSKFVENSRKWLSNYIKDNHLQSIVIGISGGIDSTISCAIASPVCKELNISLIGRSLPCNTNKEEETNSANLVGKAFCTDYKEVTIEPMYRVIENELSLNEGSSTHLQSGNIKARLRMIYLRHLASIHKGVVLDNDNFTEWNLGFWTVGGDSPMDINLGLHYLWKTEIYELAEYLCEYYRIGYINSKNNSNESVEVTDSWFNKYEALRDSKQLTPTDGNGVSNSDCEQFGLDNYEQVDDVLKTVYYTSYAISSKEAKDAYIRLIDSYNEQGVDKVMLLHQNAAYKRKGLPIKPTPKELGLC